jgi:selenide, water dikinase
VGFAGSDDAGVFRLGDGDRTLVQSVDFFTPIVDDPYDWGRIAAANALSDLYAMGAEPMTALQLVGWPREGSLPMSVLGTVVSGGADVMADAGCVIVGGHSIDAAEPTYGFAVTGLASTGDLMTNDAAEPGQVIILTKPIGTGIIATALKHGRAPADVAAAAVGSMATLNRAASDAARRIGVRAATDVTGFGLLGHLAEVVRASAVSATIERHAVPTLPGVTELIEAGMIPGGTRRNLEALGAIVDFGDSSEHERLLLADAQTSGGLLLCVDAPLANALDQALDDSGVDHSRIGRITERTFTDGPSGQIRVV